MKGAVEKIRTKKMTIREANKVHFALQTLAHRNKHTE